MARASGIKWLGNLTGNPKRGLLIITGLIVLNDSETGLAIHLGLAIEDLVTARVYERAVASGVGARRAA